jgi:hypothetical protein
MQAAIVFGVVTLLVLFLAMILFIEFGRRLRLRSQAKGAEGAAAGLGAVEGALFGLMGLVLAFTFSGAISRFDDRRKLIVEEANDIGTAYLRVDLLPSAAQPQLREIMRRYVDTRIETYRVLPDLDAAMSLFAKANDIQKEIWQYAVAATNDAANPRGSMVLLPALNAMFDIANTRFWATQAHPPALIFALLGTLALVCSLLAGYGMGGGKDRNWIHIVGFALVLTITVYVIVDMEYPRMGFIRVDSFDQALVDVRATME